MPGKGTAVLDFGNGAGSDQATVTVTGQAGITATSSVGAWVAGEATASGTVDEARMAALNVTCSAPVAGSGFTIHATSPHGYITGTFKVIWAWA